MFDNINEFVKDDLKREIRSGSKVSIAAACFSIYAYQELKEPEGMKTYGAYYVPAVDPDYIEK